MAKAMKQGELNQILVNNQLYEWNETFGAYWSVQGAPKELQESDLIDADVKDMSIITNTRNLVAGEWYVIGVKSRTNEIDWGSMPICKYEGAGCWTTDHGDAVHTIWDALLQMSIDINSADAYLPQ